MSRYRHGRKANRLAGTPAPKRATIRLNVPSMLTIVRRLGLLPCQQGCVWILLKAVGPSKRAVRACLPGVLRPLAHRAQTARRARCRCIPSPDWRKAVKGPAQAAA